MTRPIDPPVESDVFKAPQLWRPDGQGPTQGTAGKVRRVSPDETLAQTQARHNSHPSTTQLQPNNRPRTQTTGPNHIIHPPPSHPPPFLGFPKTTPQNQADRGKNTVPSHFQNQQQQPFRPQQQGNGQHQQPPRTQPPPQTPNRGRSQSMHQQPTVTDDDGSFDLMMASKTRAKTPQSIRVRPGPGPMQPEQAQRPHPPTPSSSPADIPAEDIIYNSPQYYTDRPQSRRPLSPSPPPLGQPSLPPPKIEREPANYPPPRSQSRAAPREQAFQPPPAPRPNQRMAPPGIIGEAPARARSQSRAGQREPVVEQPAQPRPQSRAVIRGPPVETPSRQPGQQMRRSSTSIPSTAAWNPEMPPPPVDFLQSAVAMQRTQEKLELELESCRSTIAEMEQELAAAHLTVAERDTTCEELKSEKADLEDAVQTLRNSKATTAASARRTIDRLKEQVVKIESAFQEIQLVAQTPASVSSEIERLRSELVAVVSFTGDQAEQAEGDENQENSEVATAIIPYRTLLEQHAESTKRAKAAAAIAKTATTELVAVEKDVKSLRSQNGDLEREVQLEKINNQLLTQRMRDLEQRLAEADRKYRDDTEEYRAKIKTMVNEQLRILPEREIASAARIHAEVETQAVKKELASITKNLESLREEHDSAQERFDLGVSLLTKLGVLDEDGQIDDEQVTRLEKQEEVHEVELAEMRSSLENAGKEISENQALIARLREEAEMSTSQRLEAEAAGAKRDQEAVIALQTRVGELEQGLKGAEARLEDTRAEYEAEEKKLVEQLQEMQDRGNNQEKAYTANETRLKAAVETQASTARKQAVEIQSLKEKFALGEQERLRSEASKSKSASPSSADTALRAEMAKLRAQVEGLQKDIIIKDSELAAADEGEMERKEEIEKLIKARDSLASELKEAKEHIRDLASSSFDRSGGSGANIADLEREVRQLKESNISLRKQVTEQQGDVVQRYKTDRLTPNEEKAISMALIANDEARAQEIEKMKRDMKKKDEVIRSYANAEDRLRKENQALVDQMKGGSGDDQISSDLTSPSRSDQTSPSKTAGASSSRPSGSSSKKSDNAGRAIKKARFDDASIQNKDKSNASKSGSTIGVGKNKGGHLQATSAELFDPIQPFSSQMGEMDDFTGAGPSSMPAPSKGASQKRRHDTGSDDEYLGDKPPAKSPSTSKAANKSTKKNAKSKATKAAAAAAASLALPPATQRQTRASSRQPSDASITIASTPMPVPTQNPSKLRHLGQAAVQEEEMDELDED